MPYFTQKSKIKVAESIFLVLFFRTRAKFEDQISSVNQ